MRNQLQLGVSVGILSGSGRQSAIAFEALAQVPSFR